MEEKYGSLKGVAGRALPLGLCYLASMVRSKGFNAKILDAEGTDISHENILEQIAKDSPRHIGISAVTLAINAAARTAKAIKAKFDIPIILGGPHITAVPAETMEAFPQFDIGVIGEGEITTVELLQALTEGKNLELVDGLIFRKNNQIVQTTPRKFIDDIDSLPLPAWDLLPNLAEVYKPIPFSVRQLPSTALVTGRGCWAKCEFCDRSVFGNRMRAHSAVRIVEMIKLLMKDYGIRDIFIDDDTFTSPRSRVTEFCHLLISENIDITWACATRVDLIDEELLHLMKRAGCWQVAFGIESGSQKILDLMKKGITVEKAKEKLALAKKAGITTKAFFMIGYLKETKETLQETLDFILTAELDVMMLSFATPLPNTAFLRRAEQYGKVDADWRRTSLYSISFVPHGLTKEDMVSFRNKAIRKFYLKPRVIWTYLKQVMRHPSMAFHMLNGGLTILGLQVKANTSHS